MKFLCRTNSPLHSFRFALGMGITVFTILLVHFTVPTTLLDRPLNPLNPTPYRAIHTIWNTDSLVMLDPLLSSLGSLLRLLTSGSSEAALISLMILVFIVGTAQLLSIVVSIRVIKNSEFICGAIDYFSGASSTGLLLFTLLGGDIALWSSICWVPWWLSGLLTGQARGWNHQTLMFTLFTLLLFFISSNALVLSWALYGAALTVLFAPPRSAKPIGWHPTPVFLICSFALIRQFFLSAPKEPLYLPDSHVVPISPDNLLLRPWVGPGMTILHTDWTLLREHYQVPALALLLLCMGASVTSLLHLTLSGHSQGDPGDRQRNLSFLLVGLSSLAIFEAFAPNSVALLSPVRAAPRVIPALSFAPFHSFVVCGAVLSHVLLTFHFSNPNRRLNVFERSLSLGLALALLITGYTSLSISNSKGMGELLKKLDRSFPPGTPYRDHVRQVLASPSLPILRDLGLSVLDKRELVQAAYFQNANDTLFSDRATTIPTPFRKLQNYGTDRRWKVTQGQQEGTEWLGVHFSSARPVYGIELDTGSFHSDFPRGILVISPESCEMTSPIEDGTVVYRNTAWQGSLRFTPEGYPAFSPQGEVRLFLDKPDSYKCLQIFQTQDHPYHDWSVTQVRFYP